MTEQNIEQTGGNEEKLVGWLVSYGLDAIGYSYEIRTGRAFITGDQSIHVPGLMLSDNSISPAHAVILADDNFGLHILDIFSTYGTFVTRGGSDQEERVEGPTSLQHGDWIRVGDHCRFQVCLLNGSGN